MYALCIYDFFDFCGRNMRCSRGELRWRSLLSGRLLAKEKMAQEVSNKPQDRLAELGDDDRSRRDCRTKVESSV